jgi:hypothetical protein
MKNLQKTKKITRAVFTKEEDMLLLNLVRQYGENWIFVSSLMLNRNPRQIRERYRFYLDPSITKAPWTKEEDFKLIELIQKHGTSWKTIAESFEGRNEVNVKNRWNYYLSKHCSDLKKISVDEFLSMDEENNDQIIQKLYSQETDNQTDFLFIENEKSKPNHSFIEEKREQKNPSAIFRFYRDEDIELSLYSIEPVKFSDFLDYL